MEYHHLTHGPVSIEPKLGVDRAKDIRRQGEVESGISGLTHGRASTESKLVVDRYEDNSLEGDTVGQLLQAGPQHLVAGQEGQLEFKYNSRS